jgi:cytochrome P450
VTLSAGTTIPDPTLSLYHLLDPEVLANPYPLYHRLQTEDPVHWDPFLHSWVVTRYSDVLSILHMFSADCAPKPEVMAAAGMSEMSPIAKVLMNQFLFMDPPRHTQLRGLVAHTFSPHRVENLRSHIRDLVNNLLDAVESQGRMEVMANLANPLPTIVSAEFLGLPVSDHEQLKAWSTDFAEILGNFQHNTDRASRMLRSLGEVESYLRAAIREQQRQDSDGLVNVLATAEVDGVRLTEEEVIANSILLMVGAQETTPNLIGCGIMSLLRNPGQLERLRSDFSLISPAVEELLRYESPSQHTTRLSTEDTELGGKEIRKRQAMIVVMGAANRDPERFPEPDRLDITRDDNKHLAFGAASHYCFGAPLARIEGQIAIETVLRRFPNLALEPEPLAWRYNAGLRGLEALPVRF